MTDRDLILKIFDKLDRIDMNVSELRASFASLDATVESYKNKLSSFEARITALENAGKRWKTWALMLVVGAIVSGVVAWEVRKVLS
ncbi:hypothetical protein [Fluviispira vulneris]|uniref:hypothetical protein n=1 Tax=Fluviispira vulneris TaxID=2763012 RepID=UPI0016453197|nr:hypothetical protein [Fluviispira vulneris]